MKKRENCVGNGILTADIGMPSSGPMAMQPYISELLLISGKRLIGMSKYLHNVGSQWSVSMFINIVLDAFVTSVMYRPSSLPPVKFCETNKFLIKKIKNNKLWFCINLLERAYYPNDPSVHCSNFASLVPNGFPHSRHIVHQPSDL